MGGGGGGAGFGGDGVEAAFEEIPIGAGEGEVLRGNALLGWYGLGGGRENPILTAPRIPKPSSMLPQIAAQQ